MKLWHTLLKEKRASEGHI